MLPPQSGFVQEWACQICAKSWPRWGSTGVGGPQGTKHGEPKSTDVERAGRAAGGMAAWQQGGRQPGSKMQGSDRHGRSLSFPCLVRIFTLGV